MRHDAQIDKRLHDLLAGVRDVELIFHTLHHAAHRKHAQHFDILTLPNALKHIRANAERNFHRSNRTETRL